LAYNITYKKSVQKDLSHLGKAETRRILEKIENDLAEKAESYPLLKGQFAGLRKLRIGEYRVIFALLDKEVLILRIGYRREIYNR